MYIKRIVSVLMTMICLLGCFLFPVTAENDPDVLTDDSINRASGLIYQYGLHVSKKDSTTITIEGLTDCDPVVVRCGFKNLLVQSRLNPSSPWTTFHNYGDDCIDSDTHEISKNLTIVPGYQYRATCKHYAKKNILNTQTISNSSNVVTF